jgi:hypothetical protein
MTRVIVKVAITDFRLWCSSEICPVAADGRHSHFLEEKSRGEESEEEGRSEEGRQEEGDQEEVGQLAEKGG